MSIHRTLLMFAFSLVLATGCGRATDPNGAAAKDGAPSLLKVSLFEKAGYADIAVSANGALHVVFDDQADPMKNRYLYYTTSTDNGKTWSAPLNISEDDTTNDPGFARILVDAGGRVYAIWKYINRGTILDGPGGYTGGRLTYRVLQNGTWSKRQQLHEVKVPAYSWFACLDPAGKVNLVWSQMTPADAAATWASHEFASLIRHTVLDGATPGTPRDLVVPKPLLTDADKAALYAAAKPVPYRDTVPRRSGILSLRGYVDAAGLVHFVGEDPGVPDANDRDGGRRVVYFDGTTLHGVHEYDRSLTRNTFNNPPSLLLDAAGNEHFIHMPESTTIKVRDYSISAAGYEDPTEVIAPPSEKGSLYNWQPHQLPGGRIALTASISATGGFSPDDAEMYIVYLKADGTWTAPLSLTGNAKATTFSHTETSPGNSVSLLTKQSPRFAAIAPAPNGTLHMVLVNSSDTIIGFTSPGVTSSGSAVSYSSGARIDAPVVYYTAIPAPPAP